MEEKSQRGEVSQNKYSSTENEVGEERERTEAKQNEGGEMSAGEGGTGCELIYES